jgi:hypothetical protein
VALGELLCKLLPEYLSPNVKSITNSKFRKLKKFQLDLKNSQLPGDNWRLKASNLKKIMDSVTLYYSECLDLSLEAHLKPEVTKIAEHNDEGKKHFCSYQNYTN